MSITQGNWKVELFHCLIVGEFAGQDYQFLFEFSDLQEKNKKRPASGLTNSNSTI
jgi:hypothetical protein